MQFYFSIWQSGQISSLFSKSQFEIGFLDLLYLNHSISINEKKFVSNFSLQAFENSLL